MPSGEGEGWCGGRQNRRGRKSEGSSPSLVGLKKQKTKKRKHRMRLEKHKQQGEQRKKMRENGEKKVESSDRDLRPERVCHSGGK